MNILKLITLTYTKMEKSSENGVCRVCGCTDDNACYIPGVGPCWWVDETHTLCSHCVEIDPEDIEREDD